MQKKIDKAFLGILILIMVTGLWRSLVAPEEISEVENRSCERVADLTWENYMDSTFQDSLEASMSDQIRGALDIKAWYNNYWSSYNQMFLQKAIALDELRKHERTAENNGGNIDDQTQGEGAEQSGQQQNPPEEAPTFDEVVKDNAFVPVISHDPLSASGTYYKMSNKFSLYNGYLVRPLIGLDDAAVVRASAHLRAIEDIQELYPDINVYMYYVEDSCLYDFAKGTYLDSSDWFLENCRLPSSHVGRLHIENFTNYSNWFYKADHHWCNAGSYTAYVQIMKMMRPSVAPIEPLGEYKVGIAHGSLTRAEDTAQYYDDVMVYEFDFPQITVSGDVSEYGKQQELIAQIKQAQSDTSGAITYNANAENPYAIVYGNDFGFLQFHNPEGDGALLVISNSFDNALLDLFASHYEYVYSIDTRYKTAVRAKSDLAAGESSTSLNNFIDAHYINDILYVGNTDLFVQDSFDLTDFIY